MSSSSTATTDTASATNLFPTTTASSASSSSSSSQNPTVYYFVFLGVLVILLCVAACLAYRAYRMRRRYRTARQMAIARGEPFMAGREDYWGLGGLSGWTSEGADRLAVERAAMEWEARRLGRKGRWEKTPALWESEVGDKEDQAKDLEDALPLMLQPMLPPTTEPMLDYDTPRTQRVDTRTMGPRPRPPPLLDLQQRAASLAYWRRGAAQNGSAVPEPPSEVDEPDGLSRGDVVRVAVVIRMPTELEEDSHDIDDEERPGWEHGMELGVWEGQVAAGGDEADHEEAHQ
ncbi:hypothetical protein EHS25_003508 [Saitozyma podzolica]|uniref:Uncharacterized protein n=1 Tax=Saitozyma podzolica TaxID=1890683 RepID=A0A427Y7F0_9TREE|nr:hypothetical protein EHS25_003508 [Saitozyma podzolica]